MSLTYVQPVDPIDAAREAGVEHIAQLLANAQDPDKPWVIFGAGCVIDSTTVSAETLALWRSTGRVTTPVEVTVPPPTISDVLATPNATDGTQTTITWTTDLPSDSQVHYGADSAYGTDSPLDTTQVTSHSVTLTGLTAATTYHYAVASGGTTSPDGTFTTVA